MIHREQVQLIAMRRADEGTHWAYTFERKAPFTEPLHIKREEVLPLELGETYELVIQKVEKELN